jgi:hypothetical protein
MFGPEWYVHTAYRSCQPSRKVVRRAQTKGFACYWDETLECGHVLRKVTGKLDSRSCPECPPELPWTDLSVTVIVDDIVPYVPGDPRKKGWCFVHDTELKVPAVGKSSFLLVNPAIADEVKRHHEANVERCRASRREWWRENHAIG